MYTRFLVWAPRRNFDDASSGGRDTSKYIHRYKLILRQRLSNVCGSNIRYAVKTPPWVYLSDSNPTLGLLICVKLEANCCEALIYKKKRTSTTRENIMY